MCSQGWPWTPFWFFCLCLPSTEIILMSYNTLCFVEGCFIYLYLFCYRPSLCSTDWLRTCYLEQICLILQRSSCFSFLSDAIILWTTKLGFLKDLLLFFHSCVCANAWGSQKKGSCLLKVEGRYRQLWPCDVGTRTEVGPLEGGVNALNFWPILPATLSPTFLRQPFTM